MDYINRHKSLKYNFNKIFIYMLPRDWFGKIEKLSDYSIKEFPNYKANSTDRLLDTYISIFLKNQNIFKLELIDGFEEIFNSIVKFQNSKHFIFTFGGQFLRKYNNLFENLLKQPKSIKDNIYIGTEGSYDKVLGLEMMNNLYTNFKILRHTPKTDRNFYLNNDDFSCISEFEVGIRTELLPKNINSEKQYVVVVDDSSSTRAFKYNGLEKKTINRLNNILKRTKYKLYILNHKYSTVDFFKLMDKTLILINFSVTETFSYVVHDAKACGVITLSYYPMFQTNVDKIYFDNYPDLTDKYYTIDDLTNKVKKIIKLNRTKLLKKQIESVEYVKKYFSTNAIKQNFFRLLDITHHTIKNDLYITNKEIDEKNFNSDKTYYINTTDIIKRTQYDPVAKKKEGLYKIHNQLIQIDRKYYFFKQSKKLTNGASIHFLNYSKDNLLEKSKYEKLQKIFYAVIIRIYKITHIYISKNIKLDNSLLTSIANQAHTEFCESS